MMPQPIPGKLTDLHFGSERLITREKLTARLAAALNEWSKTEGSLGLVLGNTLSIRYSIATETLNAVVNLTARLDVVKAAANATLTAAKATEVCDLMEKFRRRAGERNGISHGIWGVSNDYPDRLVLCDPKNAFRIVNRHYETGLVTPDILDDLKPHLNLWSESCFIDLQQRFFALQTEVITLSNTLVTP
jgi:hypothetical protein